MCVCLQSPRQALAGNSLRIHLMANDGKSQDLKGAGKNARLAFQTDVKSSPSL